MAEETSKASFWQRFVSRPFAHKVAAAGPGYLGIAFIALTIDLIIAVGAEAAFGPDSFLPFTLFFAALFLLASVTVLLTGKKWALVLALIMNILFFLLFVPFLISVLTNPADPLFWLMISGLPLMLLSLVFTILALPKPKEGAAPRKSLDAHVSTGGLVAVLVVGFAVGGVVTGIIGGAEVSRVFGLSGNTGDITIIPDAQNLLAEPFAPGNFTVSGGETVTWYNSDTRTPFHTVTSDPGTPVAFSSPDLLSGESWSYTFDTPGTYSYFCTPHPGMQGTIIVE